MEKLLLSMLLAPIFMLSACVSSASNEDNQPFYEESNMVTLFFSDPKAIDKEHTYYDALLEFQTHHPEQLSSFYVIEAEDKDKVKQYDIETFPTMLILSGEHIHLRLEGPQRKDNIISNLTNMINTQKNQLEL
ncbi:hypothetical protein M3689_06305 [Alkalihalophilus marmarensis]|jgi:hypothetical protein|uniref:Small peptidoglycan-associated lipoprotein n=1 Tax=Alkalihalophilus marmarensis DSM 21297 TaxID=1188261 RepID=U6SNC0_9BACI|nr:hypothetical protein [Alkalihalophilus marmarensis]ERN53108.1 hypothetical protein A33I_13220 [Alkalihalophilus marmarensis DSM 21297]MCM3488919.1 hypothetical protein [Alkalihalophilus marmarensis]